MRDFLRRMIFGVVLSVLLSVLVSADIFNVLELPGYPKAWEHVEDETQFVFIGKPQKDGIRFQIRKSEITKGEFALDLESDAKQVRLVCGDDEVVLKTSRGKCRLRFEHQGTKKLRVNGKIDPKYRGTWLRMMLNSNGYIEVLCEDAGYLNIGYGGIAKKLGDGVSSIAIGGRSKAKIVHDINANYLFKDIKSSIMRIEVLGRDGETISHGSGFIVVGDLIITNYDVVDGGYLARMVYRVKRYDLELVAFDKQRDLAALMFKDRIETDKDKEEHDLGPESKRLRFEWLKFAKDMPGVGESVWLMGYPYDNDLVIEKGLAGGTEKHRDWGMARVVKTDCTVNEGNIGGALVDRTGACIGVVAKSDGEKERVGYGVSAREVESFIDQCNMRKPKTFAEMPRKLDIGAGDSVPNVKIDSKVPSRELLRLAMNFKQGIVCGVCDGHGETKKRGVIGQQKRGTDRTIYGDIEVECSACRGTGIRTTATVLKNMKRMTEKLVRMEDESDDAQFVLERLKKGVREGVMLQRDRLQDLFNEQSIKDKKAGEVVFMIGLVKITQPSRSVDEHVMYVKMSRPNVRVLLTNPKIVDLEGGKYSLMGGMVAGEAKVKGETYFVVQNGYLIGIPEKEKPKSKPKTTTRNRR